MLKISPIALFDLKMPLISYSLWYVWLWNWFNFFLSFLSKSPLSSSSARYNIYQETLFLFRKQEQQIAYKQFMKRLPSQN